MYMRPILMVLGLVLTTVTCGITSTARGISVLLEVNPLVAMIDDTVTFTVSVSATSVSDVVINFADGSGDQKSAGGLAAAQLEFTHVYDDTGSYLARATVTDKAVGNRVVTQMVVVNPRTEIIPDSHRRR